MAIFHIQAKSPQTGQVAEFIYDNQSSSLVHAQTGRSVVSVMNVMPRPEVLVVSVDSPGSKSSPRTLKISLGLSCNYECEYCSQRFVARSEETNPGDAHAFMDGLDGWVTQPPEKIEFWGGEPLVYLKTLMPLAQALRQKYPSARLSIITNGSLLTKELNAWIDDMGFSIGISHDGPGQHVRGPDPLVDPARREAILDLYARLAPQGRISFNVMLNSQNQSRQAVREFFTRLTGDAMVPIGEGGLIDAYDAGGQANSLQSDEHMSFRRLAFQEMRAGQAVNFRTLTQRVGNFVNSIRSARPASSVGQKCGMDSPDNVAVDLRGNVLTCQNASAAGVAPNGQGHRIGHVSNLKKVALKTATHWSLRKDCPSCPVLQICQGSCMFLEGRLWDVSCDNAFSDAIPVFAAGIEFLTGHIPFFIEGDFREDRKDIFGMSGLTTPTGSSKRKKFPIAVVAA